jgi:hypothetical protein
MGKKRTNNLSALYGLLILVILLQAVAIGLVVRFEDGKQKRDGALLDRTELMLKDIFPGIRSDLAAISEQAIDIKKDVLGLQDRVSKVDEHVSQVGQGVVGVSGQVDGLGRKVTGFFLDRSGLIWGHSLNPYVLAALLVMVLLSVPIWGWFFRRKHGSPAPAEKGIADVAPRMVTFAAERATDRVRVYDPDKERFLKARPELRKIMEETGRLIDHARDNNGLISQKFRLDGRHLPGNTGMLH